MRTVNHERRVRRGAVKLRLAAALLVVAAAMLPPAGCRRGGTGGGTARESVIFAVGGMPLSAPVYVALEKGFFEKEGLDVTFQPHAAGKDALASVVGGRAHFCASAETPVMFAALQGEKILILATVATARNHLKIVARKDTGIAGPKDLKGKRVAAFRRGAAEYFLDAYLTYHGIRKADVRVLDVGPEETIAALKSGAIDAAVTWDPLLATQLKALGGDATVLENERIYQLQWNIVAGKEFVAGHPELVDKVLRALIEGIAFVREHPEEAHAITARRLGGESFDLAEYDFRVTLGQSLLVNLENQARWAIRNGLVDAREVPSFLPLLYTRGLDGVGPRAVTAIHR